MRLAALAVLLASTACTLPAVMPEVNNTEFKPTGQVLLYDRIVSFDAVRVRSPSVNLSRRTDGSWGGVLGGRAIDVSVSPTRIFGVDFVLTREKSQADKQVYTGQFQGKIYRFELSDERMMIRGPGQSLDLPGRQVGPEQTVYGPMGNLQLRGEAGLEDPPWPQFAFALVAMMTK